MKKTFAILLTMVFVLAFSACGENTNGMTNGSNSEGNQSLLNSSDSSDANSIDRERAIELALQKAGLKRDEIRDLEVEFDREQQGYVWEVDFEYSGHDYSYDINAKTGEIIKVERGR